MSSDLDLKGSGMNSISSVPASPQPIPSDTSIEHHPSGLLYWFRVLSIRILRRLASIDHHQLLKRDYVDLKEGVLRSTIHVPSREKGRTIKVDVYRKGDTESKGVPILLNFHGSGFTLPSLGADSAFCQYIASRSNFTVLDCDYRKSPEWPFPSAFNDTHDLLSYCQSHFSPTSISVSGFSAGANLAMALAISTEPGTIKGSIGFYGNPSLLEKHDAPNPKDYISGLTLPPWLRRFFYDCLILPKQDRSDPRLSPMNAGLERWPQQVLLVCGTADNLHEANRRLAEKLEGRKEGRVEWMSVEKEAHAFDKKPKEETEVKVKAAYQKALEMLERTLQE